MAEAGEVHVHAGDEEAFAGDAGEDGLAGGDGLGGIDVEADADGRAGGLDVGDVHDVAPDEQGGGAFADVPAAVAGGVAGEGDAGDAGEGGAGDLAGAVLVGGGGGAGGGEGAALGFGGGGFLGRVEPVGGFFGRVEQFGAGEDGLAVGGGEAAGVVAVEMGEEDGVDLVGGDAGGLQVLEGVAGGGAHVGAGAGVDEEGLAGALDEVGVDVELEVRAGEAVGEEAGGVVRRDAEQEGGGRGFEEAVMEGGDGELAELAAVVAGVFGHSAAFLVSPRRPARSWMNCQATRPEREPRVTDHSLAWVCRASRVMGRASSSA